MRKESTNGHHPQEEIPESEIGKVFQDLPTQVADYVVHLEKLVEAMMLTDNMRIRAHISRQLQIHIIRADTLAEWCSLNKDTGKPNNGFAEFPQTKHRIVWFKQYVLELSQGVDGKGMKNLIQGLGAARPAPSFMPMDGNGLRDRISRVMGKR